MTGSLFEQKSPIYFPREDPSLLFPLVLFYPTDQFFGVHVSKDRNLQLWFRTDETGNLPSRYTFP